MPYRNRLSLPGDGVGCRCSTGHPRTKDTVIPASQATPTARLDVLLVEDDVADVALVEDVFASRGLPGRLHVVPDGVEALGFLRRTDRYADAPRPDLILLDLNMPRMDGREVLSIVKGDPELRLIPVVVFTTSRQDEDVLASYGARANAYVTKPLELENFEEAVEQIHRFYGELVVRPG